MKRLFLLVFMMSMAFLFAESYSPFSPFLAEVKGLESLEQNPAGIRNGRIEYMTVLTQGAAVIPSDVAVITKGWDYEESQLGSYDTEPEIQAHTIMGMSTGWMALGIITDSVIPMNVVERVRYFGYVDNQRHTYVYDIEVLEPVSIMTADDPVVIGGLTIGLGPFSFGVSGSGEFLYDEASGEPEGLGDVALDLGGILRISNKSAFAVTADNLYFYNFERDSLWAETPSLNAGFFVSLFDIGLLEPFIGIDARHLESFFYDGVGTTPTIRGMFGIEVLWLAEARIQYLTEPLKSSSEDRLSVGFGFDLGFLEMTGGASATIADLYPLGNYFGSTEDCTDEAVTLDVSFKLDLGRNF